jgi:hypothetical protein
MDDNTLEDLVRRLTALVGKLDQTDDHLVMSYDQLVAMHQEQHEFNRQQVRINADVSATLARLETLMTEVFRQRANGREA